MNILNLRISKEKIMNFLTLIQLPLDKILFLSVSQEEIETKRIQFYEINQLDKKETGITRISR